ncbi:hypothetical protein DFH06DRAFT_1224488 [Mycena polygramma]|nr:hypothetical protein DFH06DRAFT_1224488 [Mycena polygramma]
MASFMVACPVVGLLGPGLSFGSATLFLFEYCLTFFDELRFVWFQPRAVRSASTFLFVVARYAGMASAIATLVQTPTTSLVSANLSTALRVIVIVASEAILAVRTWAIWEKNRSILIILCIVSVAAVVGNAVLLGRGVNGTHAQTSDGNCIIIINDKSQSYLITYVVVIAYETITISLSAARLMKWRSQISSSTRIPLLEVLWNDGLVYFSWMIGLGILNILLILHGGVAVRTGGAQLQSSIHSILSTRIVLHLAKLPGSRGRPDRGSVSASSLFTPTTLLLTTNDTSYRDTSDEYNA